MLNLPAFLQFRGLPPLAGPGGFAGPLYGEPLYPPMQADAPDASTKRQNALRGLGDSLKGISQGIDEQEREHMERIAQLQQHHPMIQPRAQQGPFTTFGPGGNFFSRRGY